MALISLNNLERFFNNLKTYISNALSSKANTSHTHTSSDITDLPSALTVDSALSSSSENPVQNKVIKNALDEKIPLAGSNQISGSLIPATDNAYNLGDSSHNFKIVYAYAVYNGVNNKSLVLSGGNNMTNGAYLVLYGANRTDGFQGNFQLTVNDGTSSYVLKGHQSGMLSWSGNVIRPTTDNACDLGNSTYNFKNVYAYKLILKNSYIVRTANNDYLGLCGGTDYSNGAYFSLYGKDSTINSGGFRLRANDGTNSKDLIGKPNGTLTWGSKNLAMQEDVVPRSGGAVMTSNRLGRVDVNGELSLCGGMDLDYGSSVCVFGKSYPNFGLSGAIRLITNDGSNSPNNMYMYPSGTWLWQGQAVQLTSDQRYKQQIDAIDDKLLDAWADVAPVQFKYNDSVNEKGDKARLHTGYVVQQIDSACESHGVDISAYGLYCHEEYPERTEEVEVEQADGTKTKETKVIREASEHYSLRYTEALIVECAYLRKCIKELKEEIKELKNK